MAEKQNNKPSFFDKLRAAASTKLKELTGKAVIRANDIRMALGNKRISGRQLFTDKSRMFVSLRPVHLGKMCMFFYDPKLKADLPYYDRNPLVIPLELYDNGFLGLNLHYLPPQMRARLMDMLYDRVYKVSNSSDINEKKRYQVSYQLVKMLSSIGRHKLFAPCTKRYLYSHLRSRIYILDPNDWEIAIYLPNEDFAKLNKQRVWAESVQKAGIKRQQ